MSTTTHTHARELTVAELENTLRDRIRTVLVDHSDSEWTLHIPSRTRWMEPVCGSEGNWLDKPVELYPHYAACKACAEQRFGGVHDE